MRIDLEAQPALETETISAALLGFKSMSPDRVQRGNGDFN